MAGNDASNIRKNIQTPEGRVKLYARLAIIGLQGASPAGDDPLSPDARVKMGKLAETAIHKAGEELARAAQLADVAELKAQLAELREQMKGSADGVTRASNAAPFVVRGSAGAH